MSGRKKIPKDSKNPLCMVSSEMRDKNKIPNSWKKIVLYVFEEKLSYKSAASTYIVGYDSLIEDAAPQDLFYEGLFETTYAGIRRIKAKEEYLFVLNKENSFKSMCFSQKTFEKWSLSKIIFHEEEVFSTLTI